MIKTKIIKKPKQGGGIGKQNSSENSSSINLSPIYEALRLKLDAEIFNDLFEKVNIGSEADPLYAIRAKYGLFSNDFISAKGINSNAGTSGTGGKSYLYELLDVNPLTVKSPSVGDALVYRNGKWTAEAIQSGLNTDELAAYLTGNNYAKKNDIPSLSGYATEKWVTDQKYLKSVAWGDVTGKPSWIKSTAPSFTDLSSHPTTLAGYGITDAYTKAEADGKYVTLNTAQTITARKLFTTPFAIRMNRNTSNAVAFGWRNADDSETIASVTYHNTVQRLYLNPQGSENVYEDAVGKYSLRIGVDTLTYNTYPILRSDNFGTYLDGTYLKTADAIANYLSKTEAASTYLKIADASNTYVKKSGDTMTGVLTIAPSGYTCIRMMYEGGNYILAPNGRINLLAGGDSPQSAKATLIVDATVAYPGTTNTFSFGDSSHRWSSLYSVLGNFSGLITATGGVTIPTAASLKIGDCEITWTSDGLKFSKGIYSEQWVSAKGIGSGGTSGASGKSYLYDLLDVEVSSRTSNQFLVYNGSKWTNRSITDFLDSYVTLGTAQTITGIKTFNIGFQLNTSTSWGDGDRAIPFGQASDVSIIRYYNTDPNIGLTFNANKGALKAAQFVKRGGTAFQFLKADGSVDSNTYLTTDTASSTYVKKSGDTMTGTLTINVNSASSRINFTRGGANYIKATNEAGYFCFLTNGVGNLIAESSLTINGKNVYPGTTNVGSLGTSSNRWANLYATTINVTSTNLVDNLNADLLDGQQGSWYQNNVLKFHRVKSASSADHCDADTDANNGGMLYNYSSVPYWDNAPADMSYGQILTLSSGDNLLLAGQLAWDVVHTSVRANVTKGLWWRAFNTTTQAGWGDWKQIAFTDSNIASADRLSDTSAYRAWGQVFFTNGKPQTVSGALTDVTSITMSDKLLHTYTVDDISSQRTFLNFGNNSNYDFILGDVNGRMIVRSAPILFQNSVGSTAVVIADGNVGIGIGTTSPSYKLHVGGTFYASGATTLASTLAVYGAVTVGSTTSGSVKIGNATISWDNVYKCLKVDTGFYSDDFISAKGINSNGGSGGGGVSYNRLDSWSDYTTSKSGYVLSAGLGYDLFERYNSLSSSLSGYLLKTTADGLYQAKGDYVTTNTAQEISASKTFTGTSTLIIRMNADTSNAKAITWKNTSGDAIGTITYHNTEQRLVLNSQGSQSTWNDTVGKYSLKIGVDELTYNTYPILRSDNFSSYLDGAYIKKSGDTMTGSLTIPGYLYLSRAGFNYINTTHENGTLAIVTGGKSNNQANSSVVINASNQIIPGTTGIISLGSSSYRWSNVYANTFNVSSTDLIANLNADLLDGYHANGLFTSLTTSGNNISVSIGGTTKTLTVPFATSASLLKIDYNIASSTYTNSYPTIAAMKDYMASLLSGQSGFGNTIRVYASVVNNWDDNSASHTSGPQYLMTRIDSYGDASYGQWILATYGATNPKIVGRNGGSWTAMKTLAFTTDNVASATQLRTAQTLWGQPFNGTAPVTGNMTDVGSISASDRLTITKAVGNGYDYILVNTSVTGTPISGAHANIRFTDSAAENHSVGAIGVTYVSGYCALDFHSIYNSGYKSDADIVMRIQGNGNVGIGTTLASYKLHVAGVIYSTTGIFSDGYVSAKGQNSSSDERLKTALKPLNIDLAQIAHAPSLFFKWNSTGTDDFGTIAQYWQSINPLFASKDFNGYLSLPYGKLALISVIEVAKCTLNHEQRIAVLERDNTELKRENAELKRRLSALERA